MLGSLRNYIAYRLPLQGGRAGAGSGHAGEGTLDTGGKPSCGSPVKPEASELPL